MGTEVLCTSEAGGKVRQGRGVPVTGTEVLISSKARQGRRVPVTVHLHVQSHAATIQTTAGAQPRMRMSVAAVGTQDQVTRSPDCSYK